MASFSAGAVAMDLVLNQKQFNNDMSNLTKSVTKTFSSIKKLAIGAFSVVAVKNFTNSCVDAYKTQIESERKLLTVMSMRENATKQDIKDILALTDAQQKLGVIGDEIQLAGAQELSTYIEKASSIKTLIPIMNDMVAQQYGYNATQEEAVNIATMMGKVLEGQTGALSRYGYYFDENQEKILKFGKEEQKVAVLTEIVHNSIGDVNEALGQTAIGKQIQLANAWGDVKEQIGYLSVQIKQVFIPVLTVMVNILGTAVGYIRQFFQALGITAKAQTKTSSAVKYNSSAMKDYSDSLSDATDKAKKLNNAVAGFDELHTISTGDNDSDSDNSGSGSGVNDVDFNIGIDGEVEVSEKVAQLAETIKVKFVQLKDIIKSAWDSEPVQSFVGATTTYGDFLYNYWSTLGTNLWTNIRDTWSNIEIDVSATLSNISALWTTFWTDIDNGIQTWGQPIINAVANIFNSIWKDAVDPAVQIITKVWSDFTSILVSLWNKYGQPLINNIGNFVTTTIGLFHKIWDDILEPIVTPFLETLSWLWDNHLKGMIENISEFIMKLYNGALEIYNGFIAPIVGWLLDKLAPAWSFLSNMIIGVGGTILGFLSDMVSSAMKILGGIIDFITGIFTGNWKKAWTGVKNIFKGIIDGLVGIFKAPINLIIDGLNSFIRGLNKIKIPDWVPGVGGMGINIPTIPKLAQGAYFDARNPQLAIVGDNTREGEIVTPESKIYDQVVRALKDVQGSINQTTKVDVELKPVEVRIEGSDLVIVLDKARSDNGYNGGKNPSFLY